MKRSCPNHKGEWDIKHTLPMEGVDGILEISELECGCVVCLVEDPFSSAPEPQGL